MTNDRVSERARRELLAREQAARVEAEEGRAIAEELARVARFLTESLDVASVGERVVDAVLELFKARAAGLRLLAPDGSLVGLAFSGRMKEAFAPGHVIHAGASSVSGLAIQQGSAVSSAQVFTDPRLTLAADIHQGMTNAGDGAVLAVPLRAKGRIFGALSIADRPGRKFTDAEVRHLQSFADQAALAIDNARLYEDARRRQREAEVLADLSRQIAASLDFRTTLRLVVEGARELCDGDVAIIALRDPDTGRVRLREWVGTRWEGYRDDISIAPGKGSGGLVLQTGKPFRTDDYATDPRITSDYMISVPYEGIAAQIVVPIPGEDTPEGLLYVDRRSSRSFTDQDEAILLRLAEHAAVAIRNNRLLEAERAARAEADAANVAKDRFLAVLSHELRTPLNAIMGWARMLSTMRLEETQRAHAITVIERNTRRQAELINDLLDVSRFVAGKMDLERFPVDLVPVIQEAIETVRTDAQAKNLDLTFSLTPSTGEVHGDPLRLQQIAVNLLTNAVKFTPPGGKISVELVRSGGAARLTVSDTGDGIDAALLPHIFEPFQQGDASTTRAHQGLGLGLSIVRQLVELHGGSIRAESHGPGHGATFTVELPIVAVRIPDTAGRNGDAARAETRIDGLRVLVVDDQADARELLGLVLRQRGAAVRVVESVDEALAAFDREPIDVLISDLAMPGADGYSLIAEIRARERRRRTRAIHAVALSAYAERDIRARALSAGFDAHATKPLSPDDLVDLIARFRA